MKHNIQFACAAAAIMVVSVAARAADMPLKAPSLRAYEPTWTGYYLGGYGGYAWGRTNASTSVGATTAGYFNFSDIDSIDGNGKLGVHSHGGAAGLQGGYNWQVGTVVYGIEADSGYFGLRGSESVRSPYPTAPATSYQITSSVKTDWLLTARARAGITVGTTLIYGTAGLAITDFKFVGSFSDTFAGATENAPATKTRLGGAIGAGLETMIGSNWTAKVEYLYADFGSVTSTGSIVVTPVGGITRPNPFSHSADLNASILRLGLNYKFDTGAPLATRY
jgi:outer membrane immunogenic protein